MQRLVNLKEIEEATLACYVSADRIEHLVTAVMDFIIPEVERYFDLIEGAGSVYAGPMRKQLESAAGLLNIARDEAGTVRRAVDRFEAEWSARAEPMIRAV